MAKKVKQRKINLKNDTHVENMCEKMRRIEAKINYKTFFQISYTKKKKKKQQQEQKDKREKCTQKLTFSPLAM